MSFSCEHGHGRITLASQLLYILPVKHDLNSSGTIATHLAHPTEEAQQKCKFSLHNLTWQTETNRPTWVLKLAKESLPLQKGGNYILASSMPLMCCMQRCECPPVRIAWPTVVSCAPVNTECAHFLLLHHHSPPNHPQISSSRTSCCHSL